MTFKLCTITYEQDKNDNKVKTKKFDRYCAAEATPVDQPCVQNGNIESDC